MSVKQSTINLIVSGAFLLMALLLGGTVYFANQAVSVQQRAVDVRSEAIDLGVELQRASELLTQEVRAYAVSARPEHLDSYWKEINVTKTGEKVVARLRELGASAEELALIDQSNANSLTLTETETRAMRLVLESLAVSESAMPGEVAAFKLNKLDQSISGPDKMELARTLLFDGEYASGEAAVIKPIEDFRHAMEARLNREVQAAQGTTSSALTLLTVLALLIPLGMGAVLVVFHTQVGRPVTAYTGALAGRDPNDTNFGLKAAGTRELRALAETFNDQFRENQRQLQENQNLVSNLNGVAQRVIENAERLTQASVQMSAASEQAGAATQQIATTIQEVAAGNQTISSSVQETSQSVDHLSRAIDQIARGAQEQVRSIEKTSASVANLSTSIAQAVAASRELSSASEQTAVAANSGTETIRKSVQGMVSIKESACITASRIHELGSYSEQIGSIVEAIDDIAEQTNLLALNAAIEAARAGEHGRGFAVVADEVRKLAERSGKETKQIAALIAHVQKATQEAVAAMNRGATEVENGSLLAEQAGSALANILSTVQMANTQAAQIVSALSQMESFSREVVDHMDSVSAVVEESTAAAQEMAASSDHVTVAIEKVAAVSEETSASAEEVSASTQEMSAQVEEMVAQAQSLSRMAEELQSIVAQFNSGQSAGVVMKRRKSDWIAGGQPFAASPLSRSH